MFEEHQFVVVVDNSLTIKFTFDILPKSLARSIGKINRFGNYGSLHQWIMDTYVQSKVYKSDRRVRHIDRSLLVHHCLCHYSLMKAAETFHSSNNLARVSSKFFMSLICKLAYCTLLLYKRYCYQQMFMEDHSTTVILLRHH